MRLTNADLKRLGQIAARDRDDLFRRKPDLGRLYSGRLFAVALCQGAALHYLNGENGIKDLDVWSFYRAALERPYPYRRRGVADFGDPKFGKTNDSPEFEGRRVDLLGRSLEAADFSDPIVVLRDYLVNGRTESARLLARKAVIIIEPEALLGSVVWPAQKSLLAPSGRSTGRSEQMPKHYIYRVDHDRGFAPNLDYGICTLCGCKMTSIESWARTGSWVVGIGGNGTGKPNKLIYAMEVEKVLPYTEFRARYRRKSAYLRGKDILPAANVLLSRKFYYFGDKAIDLPANLEHIIIRGRGCKLVSDRDISKLHKHLKNRYAYGKWGNPNNPKKQRPRC